MRLALAGMLALTTLTGSCGRLALPSVGFGPRPATGLEDRIWRVDRNDGSFDEIFAFLSDGTLMIASCGGTWRLSAWRRVDDATLVWDTPEGVVHAEIALQGPEDLALLVDQGGVTDTLTFTSARAPLDCRAS